MASLNRPRDGSRYYEVETPDGVVGVTCGQSGTVVIVYEGGLREVATVRLPRDR